LKRSPSNLASFQEKIFKIDDFMGMAMAGLTADASMLKIFVSFKIMHLIDK